MKVFVINMDQDKDRLEFAYKQAESNGYNLSRIPGVNGKEMSPAQKKETVNGFRFWCINGRKPLDGEIGCALSHINIYRKMIQENIPVACVLEDDIMILSGFIQRLKNLEQQLMPRVPQVVRLNFNGSEKSLPVDGLCRSYENTSACSYCITLAGAKALLNANYPLRTMSDNWPRFTKLNIVELYDTDKKVCWHNNAASGFSSTICDGGGKMIA